MTRTMLPTRCRCPRTRGWNTFQCPGLRAAVRGILLVLLLPLTSGCPSGGRLYVPGPERREGLIAEGAALQAEMDRVHATRAREPADLDRGLAAGELALELLGEGGAPPERYEVLWRLSRASHDLAEVLPRGDQKALYARRGARYGQGARELLPDRPEGWYFVALCRAREAQADADTSPLEEVVRSARRSAEVDESWRGAAAYRLLAGVLSQAPQWPASVGDTEEAVEIMRKAMRVDPSPLNRLFLGQVLFHEGEEEEAIAELERAWTEGKAAGLEARWLAEAEDYLGRMDRGPP